jgi:predicted nucleic acid-binding protein
VRHFVDSSVFLLALGGDHPDRSPAREFLRRAERAGAALHVSVEAIRELTFHRMRVTDRDRALLETERVVEVVVLHDFDEPVLRRSLELLGAGGIRGRDAIHASTAILAGFAGIVSFDSDFDGIPGLTRTHPSQA